MKQHPVGIEEGIDQADPDEDRTGNEDEDENENGD
jgi:hypothetical protein